MKRSKIQAARTEWTTEQEKNLRRLYPDHDTHEIASVLGKTYGSVKCRATQLGLKKSPGTMTLPKNATERKIDLDEFIRLYPNRPNRYFYEKYDITYSIVKNIANKYGLKKDPSYRNPGRFNKGHKSWNKGMKGIDLGPNSRRTRFKKGHLPANTEHDGAVKIRSSKGRRYFWIRISKAKWIMLHVYLWEKENGPVPEGHIIIFKDKNPLNCRPENLECISQAENVLRNSGSINLPDSYVAHLVAGRKKFLIEDIKKLPELIELKREQIKLNRAINEQGN